MESTQYGYAMSWKQYVKRHLVGRTQTALAGDIGVSNTAISRWLKGTQGVDAGVAIRFARAVGDEPLTALIAAGYLTTKEARASVSQVPDYSQLTNDELLALVRARMSEGSGGDVQAAPMNQAAGSAVTDDDSAAGAAGDVPPALPDTVPTRQGIHRPPMPTKRSRGRTGSQGRGSGTSGTGQ